MLTADRDNDSV